MVEFTTGSKKDFMVTSVKRGRINDIDEVVATGIPEVLGDPLAWLPRLGSITPLELDVHYGLQDQPGDELPEVHVVLVDVDNLPTIESVRARAIWSGVQNWRTIGTIGQLIQTLSHAEVDWFNPETYSMTEFASFTQRLAVCFLIHSNTTSRFIAMGVMAYSETIIQRVFGSDNWTFEDPDNSEFGQDWGDDASCDSSSS